MENRHKQKQNLELISNKNKVIRKRKLISYVKFKLRSNSPNDSDCMKRFSIATESNAKKFKIVYFIIRFLRRKINLLAQFALSTLSSQ